MNCNFVHLETAESTNSYVQANISNYNPNEFSVIYTFNQLDGRGQIGRNWFSGSNENLSFSILYHPKQLSIENSFDLLVNVSMALSTAIEAITGVSTQIKWPNDIYHKDEKLAGILIQNNIRSRHIHYSIIGVGLNVNTIHFPEDLPNPISLKTITGKTFDLESLLHELCIKMCASLEENIFDRAAYQAKLYRRNIWSSFRSKTGDLFEAKILGTDQDGKLKLEKRTGEIEAYQMHDLSFQR